MKKKRMLCISVLMTAFAFGLNITGVSPILGILSEKYSMYDTSMVQLLQTLPYVFIIIGSLLIGWLTTKISKKKIDIMGLIVIGVCGVIPFFTDSFAALFLTRLLIGFGFGVVGPMNTAIISDTLPPQERAPFMGLHVVGMGVGTMIGNLIGGVLISLGERFFFLIYAVAFIAAAGVQLVLVETPPIQGEKASDLKLSKMVFIISIASFLHTMFINAYSTNVGIYILKNITDNTSITGIVTAVNAAFALVTGLLFGTLSRRFKEYTLSFSLVTAAVGYLAILFIPGMSGVFITSALCGVSLSSFMAQASYMISVSVEQNAVAKASGVFSIIGAIGGFAGPIVLGKLASTLLGENIARNQFIVAFVGFVVFTVVATLLIMKQKKED